MTVFAISTFDFIPVNNAMALKHAPISTSLCSGGYLVSVVSTEAAIETVLTAPLGDAVKL